MKRINCLLVVLAICFSVNAQIAITEAYYDSPFIERLNKNTNAHLGEFIELFNYSKEAIDVSGWRLSDNTGSYYIPQGTIINSNDFLIIARRTPHSSTYFFDLFPNEEDGNEDKVLYQSNLIMNNYRDWITLSTRRIAGQNLRRYYTVSKIKWRCGSGVPCDRNPIAPATFGDQNSPGFYNTDYDYYVPSLQKLQNADLQDVDQTLNYYAANATPFGLLFTPELVDIEDIQNVRDILESNYESLTVDEVINYYINMNCDISIPIVASENVSDTYLEEQCFTFDVAGNQENNQLCPDNDSDSSDTGDDGSSDTDFTTEEIANKIYIVPNPTSGLLNISWDADIGDTISHIVIAPMTGSSLEIPVSIPNNSNAATADLSPYSNGFYVVRFTLNNGEVITKTVIKN